MQLEEHAGREHEIGRNCWRCIGVEMLAEDRGRQRLLIGEAEAVPIAEAPEVLTILSAHAPGKHRLHGLLDPSQRQARAQRRQPGLQHGLDMAGECAMRGFLRPDAAHPDAMAPMAVDRERDAEQDLVAMLRHPPGLRGPVARIVRRRRGGQPGPAVVGALPARLGFEIELDFPGRTPPRQLSTEPAEEQVAQGSRVTMPSEGGGILEQPQPRRGIIQRRTGSEAICRQRGVDLPGQFAEADRCDASAVRPRRKRLAPGQRRTIFGGEIGPQFARQRQHERAADQKMRVVLSDEQQRQTLMPVPAAEETKSAMRSAAGAENTAEAKDRNAVGTMITRQTQQSLPPLREHFSDVARCPARHCGSGRDDDSGASDQACRNDDVCKVQRVTPLPRL